MKKNTLLVCFLLTGIMMVGCGKNDEEYNNDNANTRPAEYHDMTAARHLKKIQTEEIHYNWTGNNDTVIIPDSTVFVWQGNQVNSVHEYHYTVSDIENQVFLYDEITHTCTYEENRIANIHAIEKLYWVDSAGNMQSDMWEWDTPFSYTGMYLTEMGSSKLYYNDSSDVIDIKFIWDGEWVSQFKDPVWQNRNLTAITYIDLNNGSTWTYNYSYDNKISVYRCIPRELAIYLQAGAALSRNNVVREDDSYPYTFEYDGDYPIKRTMERPDIYNHTTRYIYE